MLKITVPATEDWDELHNQFVYSKEQNLTLEHSLVSISKWESKWQKPFLVKKEKTYEEMVDYIRCMTLTQNVDPNVYNHLTDDNLRDIYAYIESPMTATTIRRQKKGGSAEIITSEVIYYWMISLGIPPEYQKWHLNRLLMLIEVCSVKNQKPNKMSKKQLMERNSALNAARRKKFNSKG